MLVKAPGQLISLSRNENYSFLLSFLWHPSCESLENTLLTSQARMEIKSSPLAFADQGMGQAPPSSLVFGQKIADFIQKFSFKERSYDFLGFLRILILFIPKTHVQGTRKTKRTPHHVIFKSKSQLIWLLLYILQLLCVYFINNNQVFSCNLQKYVYSLCLSEIFL